MSVNRWVARASVAAFVLPLAVTVVASSHAQETKVAALKADAKAKPKDAAAAIALGRAYRRAGKWAEAKAELQRAAGLTSGEEQVQVKYELVVVEFDQGVVNKANPLPTMLPSCTAVKIGKLGEALSKVCAGEAWLTMDRAAEAEEQLAAASKIDSSLYELKLAYAKVSITKLAHDDAITKLKALTVSTPGRADAWLWLGRELIASGKRADAVDPLKKAKAIDPDWPEVRYYLSRALPDGTDARDEARTAVAMRAAWPDAHARLGELELATGGFDAAKSSFETAIKQFPKSVPAHVGLAWTFIKLKKAADAKKWALDAIKLNGTDPRARLAHAESQAALGETDEAVETFKLAAGLDSKDATGLIRAAEVLLEAKQPVKAEAHAESAVKAFPEDGRTWLVKADAMLANGDKKGAKEAYKKALAAPHGGIDKAATQKKFDAIK